MILRWCLKSLLLTQFLKRERSRTVFLKVIKWLREKISPRPRLTASAVRVICHATNTRTRGWNSIAIQLDPNLVWVNFGRGEANRMLGHYVEALEDLSRVIELVPQAPEGFASRGEVYRMLGHFEEARSDFNRALELDPSNNFAIKGRDALPRMSYEEAIKLATQMGALKPQTIKEKILEPLGSVPFSQTRLALERLDLWAKALMRGEDPKKALAKSGSLSTHVAFPGMKQSSSNENNAATCSTISLPRHNYPLQPWLQILLRVRSPKIVMRRVLAELLPLAKTEHWPDSKRPRGEAGPLRSGGNPKLFR